MARNKKDDKGSAGRTQVKDLPRKEKKLGEDEMKKIKGGAAAGTDAKHVLEKSGTIN